MGDRQERVRNEGFRWLPMLVEESNPYTRFSLGLNFGPHVSQHAGWQSCYCAIESGKGKIIYPRYNKDFYTGRVCSRRAEIPEVRHRQTKHTPSAKHSLHLTLLLVEHVLLNELPFYVIC